MDFSVPIQRVLPQVFIIKFKLVFVKRVDCRLVVEKTNRNIIAEVEHTSGKTVLSASTLEMAIASQLKNRTDIEASRFIGKVLARRCQESGITSMVLQEGPAANINVGSQRVS